LPRRQQRAKAEPAEAIIWGCVRDRKCEGAKLRRQTILENFIADVVCYERRLIVEIDGGATKESSNWPPFT
jgi:very-short-patch-repair endonuclease